MIRACRSPLLPLFWLLAFAAGSFAYAGDRKEEMLASFKEKTGLVPVVVAGTKGEYLGKTHRGYEVLFTAKAGNVWGRYTARLVAGEIGREVGGLAAFLTGGLPHETSVAGSPFDRLLARLLGQPLSVLVTLNHSKSSAPRLDIYPSYAIMKPEEPLQKQGKVGSGAGFIHAKSKAFAGRLMANKALQKRLRLLRGEYIRVDDQFVSLFWSGQETDFSSMIRDHGGYWKMIEAFLDDLADIADAIPEP